MTAARKSDLRAARLLLERAEAMHEGGWSLAAAAQASCIFRVLVTAMLAELGPQIGLGSWLEDDQLPERELADVRRSLHGALEAYDVVLAVVEAHALARRFNLEAGTVSSS